MSDTHIWKQFSALPRALRFASLFVGGCAITVLYISHLSRSVNAAPVSTTYTADHSVILSGTSSGGGGSSVPTLFDDNSRFSSGSFGNGFSCMITDDLKIWCAGTNDDYTLGDGTTTERQFPVQFGGHPSVAATFANIKFIQVSAAGDSLFGGHTCGVTTTNEIYCAGRNSRGELGIGNKIAQPNPVLFGGGAGGGGSKLYTRVASGTAHTCALTTTQQIYCAGTNEFGQLGAGLATGSNNGIPTLQLFGGTLGRNFTKVSAGAETTCAVTTLNEVYCAGLNEFGQLGKGSAIPTSNNVPVQFGVSTGKSFVSVSAGTSAICAVTTDQMVYCAGRNSFGELGDNSFIQRNNAVRFGNAGGSAALGKSLTQVSTGGQRSGNADPSAHTCVLSTEKLIYCAGDNDKHQLGYSVDDLKYPNPVSFGGTSIPTIGRTYLQVSAGEQFTCAFGTDNVVYCSGYNQNGEQGVGNNTARDKPDISMLIQ